MKPICQHPDPTTVAWLFCRDCGYYVEGRRMSKATDRVLRERLAADTISRRYTNETGAINNWPSVWIDLE